MVSDMTRKKATSTDRVRRSSGAHRAEGGDGDLVDPEISRAFVESTCIAHLIGGVEVVDVRADLREATVPRVEDGEEGAT